jgi:hypothetical protein
MFHLKNLFLVGVICGFFLCFGFVSSAQQAPQPQGAAPRADISDSDLRAFVKAYVENQKIRQEYEPPLMNTEDAKKSQANSRPSQRRIEKVPRKAESYRSQVQPHLYGSEQR